MSKLMHDAAIDDDDNDDAKALAILRVFSKNSQAKIAGNQQISHFRTMFFKGFLPRSLKVFLYGKELTVR